MVACQLHMLLNRNGNFLADHWTGESEPLQPRKSLRAGKFGNLTYRAGRFLSRKTGFSDFALASWLNHQVNGRSYILHHVHDISDAISPFSLAAWVRHAPVIWTFHDCSPFTGGCIYPLSCTAYTTKCGNCPQLQHWPLETRHDHTGWMQTYKRDLINQKLAAAICPSQWMVNEAIKAGIRKEILHLIPNAVDTNLFQPHDKQALRQKLGLPTDGKIILLGSVDLSNRYKGTQHSLNAIAAQKPGLHVLVIGRNYSEITFPQGHSYHFRNYTSDRSLLAAYYAASDLLIFPSLAESFGLMLCESMSCGTPAIAFATGGIEEIITHQHDGWLAPTGDTDALSFGLKTALEHTEMRRQWSDKARETVLSRFAEPIFLQAHLALYQKILGVSSKI